MDDILIAINDIWGAWPLIVALVALIVYRIIWPPIDDYLKFSRKEREEVRRAREQESQRWLDELSKISESHDGAVTKLADTHKQDMDRLVGSIDKNTDAVNNLVRGLVNKNEQ